MRPSDKDVRTWCERTWPAVYRHIYRLVQNREEAEDLTQETYLRVVRTGFPTGEPPHMGYLAAAATNVVRDSWRHRRPFGAMSPLEEAALVAYTSGRIVLDYGDSSVVETVGSGEFAPASHGSLGTAAGGPLEILEGSLRWRQGDLEVTVLGQRGLEIAMQISPDLTLPSTGTGGSFNPEVRVPIDMEAVENDQKQVDGGHAPWQLDPLSLGETPRPQPVDGTRRSNPGLDLEFHLQVRERLVVP